MIHDFYKDLATGKVGEARIMEWFKRNSLIDHVDDLRDISSYREVDVDFRIHFKDGHCETAELKTDGTTYPNLYYEEYSAIETGSIGCLAKTQADNIIYFYNKLGFMYRLDTLKFRAWIGDNRDDIIKRTGVKKVSTRRYDGSTYTSIGIAIPRVMIDQDLKLMGTKIFLK